MKKCKSRKKEIQAYKDIYNLIKSGMKVSVPKKNWREKIFGPGSAGTLYMWSTSLLVGTMLFTVLLFQLIEVSSYPLLFLLLVVIIICEAIGVIVAVIVESIQSVRSGLPANFTEYYSERFESVCRNLRKVSVKDLVGFEEWLQYETELRRRRAIYLSAPALAITTIIFSAVDIATLKAIFVEGIFGTSVSIKILSWLILVPMALYVSGTISLMMSLRWDRMRQLVLDVVTSRKDK